mmetsp:Transcript_23579/g.45957  ORF Transcript_23579/g.45957 Transcript_23579/m.45957 type:complete len:233 (+) Transcript_23579:3-701(+)
MKQVAWTFITVFLIVFQLQYAIDNIKAGLFWFLLPASLVICNDSMAYSSGKAFGKKLIHATFLKLSPNKTWEGFLGAFLFTVIFAFAFPVALVKSKWIVCTYGALSKNYPDSLSLCPLDPVFVPRMYKAPEWIAQLLGFDYIRVLPVQLHAVVLAVFASLVAPFGGFFASAIKRAYDIKDFDALIPGHGGIMDRMDCQFIMVMFTGVYFHTFIHQGKECCPCQPFINRSIRW